LQAVAVIIGSEIALLCIAVHYQEGIKTNANKCGLSLKFSSVEKSMLSARQPLIFSPKLCVLICALLCDSSLLIVSAEDNYLFSL